MNLTYKPQHRAMALFLTLCFLPSILPVNYMLANNNGPNAPEAASFEPVDATDMVNLVTGDFSYVLPLLNVPSPEGGYPLSLSYHAGIAMDQEASWVGLGWNLNPGAINRGVNGYPDDWGKTNVNEFYYDAGKTDTYYSISAGVTWGGGYSVGLGASWGSNQSLGGYISAGVGFGEGAGSAGVRIGTNGASVYGSYGGYSASISTSGVGIGYGYNPGGGDYSLGMSLNYNYNSGLSGGVSVAQTKSGGKKIESHKQSGMGIDFSSNGVSVNGKANGVGLGVSLASYGISSGDISTMVSSTSFFLPLYYFYIGYNKTKVTHSVFKYDNLYTSGTLYPKEALDSSGTDNSMEIMENTFMDASVLTKYQLGQPTDMLLDQNEQLTENNLVLPSYDNYAVTAQGLSGNLTPYISREANFSPRGRSNRNDDQLYVQYINNPAQLVMGGNKVNFTMANAYNSFLRTETTKINNNGINGITASNILSSFKTEYTTKYNSTGSLANNAPNQKREGYFIETFTNAEIRKGRIYGFIEADGIDRRDTDTFLDEGIGAYRITTPDGRTYHYSLPVYNFETFYKAFGEGLNGTVNESESFFELQKTKPYATHWLLTSVTGPDYVARIPGQTDNGDNGYWVHFEYGKWSDGYIWQTPNGEGRSKYNVEEDEKGKKTYSYVWGRKQIYYLDAVKTRTHTALFVKDTRQDGVSQERTIRNEKWDGSSKMDMGFHAKSFENDSSPYYAQTIWRPSSGEHKIFDYYDLKNNPNPIDTRTIYGALGFYGKRIYQYVDIPKNQLLHLSKIILLKNEQYSLEYKSKGNLIAPLNGYITSAYGRKVRDGGVSDQYSIDKELIISKFNLKLATIHEHQNTLDVSDIQGLDLESKAQQVITFDHDYSLAQGTTNSDAREKGRLALKAVHFKGKGGKQMIPPYKFSYNTGPSSEYNQDNQDDWGYLKNYPKAWSLNKIETPIGTAIDIDYEEDSYFAEAAYGARKEYSQIQRVDRNSNDLVISLGGDVTDLSNYFEAGNYYDINYTIEESREDHYDGQILRVSSEYKTVRLQLKSISGNRITFDLNNRYYNDFDLYDSNCGTYGFDNVCTIGIRVIGEEENYAIDDDNGRKGGGLRVADISVRDSGGNGATTEYDYTNPNTRKITGITSFAPSKDKPKAIPYYSELPSPAVLYGHVTLKNKDNNGKLLGKSTYHFETLEPFKNQLGVLFGMGDTFKVVEDQNENFAGSRVRANKYTIYSALANIGRLKSVTTYNAMGQKLMEKRNTYKTNLNRDGEIGVTQESHKSLRKVTKNGNETFYVSSTSKVSYPSVLERTTTHQGSFSKTTTYDKYDFLTGQVLQTTATNSEGKEIKSVAIPAYTIDEYAAMGSKVDNPSNKNMLVQQAMSKTYVDNIANTNLIGASITTWSPTTHPASDEVWRKHKSFIWDGSTNSDGLYNNFTGVYDGFNWTLEANSEDVVQPDHWKQTSEVSMYDNFSMPLEIIDINGNKAATHMGDGGTKVMATGNAGYHSLHYEGAEYMVTGGTFGLGKTSEKAHTGKYSVRITNGKGFYTGFWNNEPGVYRISVWASKDNYKNARVFDGSDDSDVVVFNRETVIAGDWVMLNHEVYLGAEPKELYVTSNSGAIYFDDFRVHPVASSMTSYVYNEWDELSHILGPNNMATYYEYDAMGRLKKTMVEVADAENLKGGFKKSSEHEYTYKY